ncbi:MAG: ATP-dependent Clp protease ATP-binding subunit [Erysipelotrichaceae bacterium]|nr:ATP-dependent Clp protease ATP-binding subunit [Erysipelotrichaceae bacterium]
MNIRFNKQVATIMKDAQKEAKDMGNNYIGSEHILLAIVHDTTSNLSKILAKQGVFYFQMKEDLMILFGMQDKDVQEIQLTQIVEQMIERSIALAKEKKQKVVDVDTLSIALLQTPNCVANEVLHRYEIPMDRILKELSTLNLHELDRMKELRNLNKGYHNKEIVGRDQEIDLMISILSRKDKANPLLIGEPGVGKTALVEKLASLIEEKEVPKTLQDCVIYELNLNALVAGTKYRGDFEEKIQNLITLVEKYPNIILFVDEIHQMIGAGKSEGSIDVSSVLKPYLARGSIRCIGATTIDEYEKYIEKDRALERRFQIVMVKEPDHKATIQMMIAKLKEYEQFHHVNIQEEVIEKMVEYCDYYMPQRTFPDKAIDVLDLACVSAIREHKTVVDEEIVRSVIEQLTDIPIATKDRCLHVRQCLERKLLGQEDVIDKVMRQMQWIDLGIIQNRPLGVWLLLGNRGVGKTTFIHELSKAYFNQEEVLELDMSTFELQIRNVLSKIKRNPYTIVSIQNLQNANATQLRFLKQGVEKGFLEFENQKIDLRHSLLIMSGDFQYVKNGSLKFHQSHNWQIQAQKELGEDFMHIFDEVYIFQDLSISVKTDILRKQLMKWNRELAEDVVQNVVFECKSLEDAYRMIRKKMESV